METTQTHYYLYDGKRYDNMKELCDEHGFGTHAFRNRVKKHIIEKILINQ